VAVFFVISGFLLYRPFVAARLGGTPVRARPYFRRRLLRIVPAYWFALTALALWPGLPGVFSRDWWLYYGFAQDAHLSTLFSGLGTAWSLGTEVSFYLLLPLYAYLLSRPLLRRSTAVLLAAELTGLAALVLGSLAFRRTIPFSERNLSFTLAGTFDWFALGMALAVISAVAAHSQTTPRVLGLVRDHAWTAWVAALAFTAGGAWYCHSTRDFHPYRGNSLHLLWGGIALCAVLPAAFPAVRAGVPHRILAHRALAWLGLISYGIYLWHFPLVEQVGARWESYFGITPRGLFGSFVVFVSVAAVTIVCAAFSYYVVERPLLRLKERRPPKPRADAPPVATQTAGAGG
jgi:peptidoglycan/LPS O-acetylase OafA/YrhL